MKNFFIAAIGFSIIIIIVPLFIVMMMGGLIDNSAKDTELINVYFSDEDTVKQINTSDYLVGVVAAEMPASFEEEALKAQAVAARTYMTYHTAKSKEHKDNASVCTDYTHCQAWVNINDKMEAWGESAEEYRKKIEKAVSDTAGEIVTYNGEAINSLFFSTSSGKTENAADVWGDNLPYLVSVDSPGEDEAPKFTSQVEFTIDEAKSKIEEQIDGTDFSNGLFSNIIRSDAGGIKTIDAGGATISGTQLRTIFGLNSTNAEIKEENNSVIFIVKGNGHGVGMSQYGAEAMAENGSNYKEILTHYYTGCQVSK